MKLLMILIFWFEYVSGLRDPFYCDQTSKKGFSCKAVAQIEDSDKKCALVTVNGKEYMLKVHDKVDDYVVVSIFDKGIALRSKKDNELKIITK